MISPTERSHHHLTETGAALVYLLLGCALLHEVVFGGRVFFFRDVSLYWLPNVEGFVRAVIGGEAPLWDPRIGFGKPILADPGEQAAYPPTWLNLLMPPTTYYGLFIVLHVVWAGLGAWKLARLRGLTPLAALTAGAVWCCSGPIVSAFSLWHHFAGIAWLPWVMLALERLLERPESRRALVLAGTAAGQALAGSADVCLMSALVASLRVLAGWRELRLFPVLRCLGLAVSVAAALGAIQWLPTLETISGSARTGYSPDRHSTWSLHPWQLAESLLAIPFDALPLGEELRGVMFDGREAFLGSVYLGIAAAGFAALGLLARLEGRLRRFRIELGAGMGLLLLLALGRHSPFYEWLRMLPGFDLVRYPVKFVLPAGLLFAWLVGVGWAAWEARWGEEQARRARGLSTACLALAGVVFLAALAQRLGPTLPGEVFGEASPDRTARLLLPALATAAGMLAAWAALLRLRARSEQPPLWIRFAAFGIVVLDLGVATLRLNPTAPADLLRTWRPRLLVPLAREPEPLRLHVLVPTDEWRQAHAVQHPAGLTGAPVSALGQFEMLSPPIAARWGVDGSFSGEFTGQERRELLEVKQLLNYNLGSQLGRRILMIGGVSHVISVEPMPYPGLERIYSIETIYDTPIHLFRVAERLPRAYAVSGRVIAQPPATYALFGDYSFDPRASVILPRGPARPARDDFSSRVTLLWRRSASVGIEAELSHDGVVVLLEGWYPGWTASVDGTPAPVLRANALFRAVEVPAGQHRVEFQYRPSGVSWGTWLTLATLVSIGSWAGLRSAGRHRRRGAVAAPAAPAKAGDPGGSDT